MEVKEKKKLFTPKGLSNDENNRYLKLNNEQPVKDGKPINQYDLDGKKQGYWEYYYNHGDLGSKGKYINDKMEGYWERYHYNGQLISKGSYVNDKKNGNWDYYNSDGSLLFSVGYVNGIKQDV